MEINFDKTKQGTERCIVRLDNGDVFKGYKHGNSFQFNGKNRKLNASYYDSLISFILNGFDDKGNSLIAGGDNLDKIIMEAKVEEFFDFLVYKMVKSGKPVRCGMGYEDVLFIINVMPVDSCYAAEKRFDDIVKGDKL